MEERIDTRFNNETLASCDTIVCTHTHTRVHTYVGIAFSRSRAGESLEAREEESRATGVWLEFNLIVPFVFASVSRYTTRNPVRVGTSTPPVSPFIPFVPKRPPRHRPPRKRLLMRVNQNGPPISPPIFFSIRARTHSKSHNLSSEKILNQLTSRSIFLQFMNNNNNNSNNRRRKFAYQNIIQISIRIYRIVNNSPFSIQKVFIVNIGKKKGREKNPPMKW